jgi:hypothetical protein
MPPGSPGPSAAAAAAAAPSAAAFSVAGAGLTPTKESTLKSGIVSALASQAARSSALVSAAPRTLSKADALSVRVHASSPLVPTSTLVSPVVRVHLVDSELGTPITPSGEATTPLQTLPFDLARRVKSAFAPEWDETLEIEEELGSLLSDRATLLFEVLQPPPSFRYFDERPDVFPGGTPAKIAWGFLKLLKSRDQTPNVGRLQVQLYRYEEVSTPHALVSSLAPRGGVTSDGAPGAVPASDRAPAVFAEWKRASRLAPALRPLYPAHLTVTVAASPRGDAATALLAGSREMPRTFALAATLSGAAPDDDEDFEKRRPSLAERIARERTLGGGWSTAERRLARAPPADGEEVTEKLGRLPYETLCYGMNPRAAAAARGARSDAGGPPRARSTPPTPTRITSRPPGARRGARSSSFRTAARAWTIARFPTGRLARSRTFRVRRGRLCSSRSTRWAGGSPSRASRRACASSGRSTARPGRRSRRSRATARRCTTSRGSPSRTSPGPAARRRIGSGRRSLTPARRAC